MMSAYRMALRSLPPTGHVGRLVRTGRRPDAVADQLCCLAVALRGLIAFRLRYACAPEAVV